MRTSLAALALILAAPAVAADDLSGWTNDTLGGGTSWVLDAGNQSVVQTVNGLPTIFYNPAIDAINYSVRADVQTLTERDDDFFGFVFGYEGGDLFSNAADYLLIDWKQAEQSRGVPGLAVSRVRGQDSVTTPGSAFLAHDNNVVREIARAANLGNTGWADLVNYTFDMVYTPDMLQVIVNGITEIEITPQQAGLSSFAGGSFGFYNFSQANTRYSATLRPLLDDEIDVPAPAALGLFAVGIAGLAVARRRRRA